MESLKIMICGDVCGNIELVYNRIKKLKKKGSNFDMLLCIGDFFGDDITANWLSYRNGTKKPPITTYILGPNNSQHLSHYEGGDEDGFELGENITYLGNKGIFTATGGLKIVYLSGIESPAGSSPVPKYCFSHSDVKSLVMSVTKSGAKDFVGVDLLLTSQWPKSVAAYGNSPSEERCLKCGSVLVSQLASAIRPRYHFAGLEKVHYERLPYRNHVVLSESARHTTRFIALSSVGNAEKQKYLYAFTISPMCKMDQSELVKQPQDATECPYYRKGKQDSNSEGKSIAQLSIESLMQDNEASGQYRWNVQQNQNQGRKRKSEDHKTFKQRKTERPQDWSCWFCLGGEKVEKHLVASVGNLTYVAMAKGGIIDDHILILPIAHHASSLDLPDDTAMECLVYKQAVIKAMKSIGKQCIFFERNYRTDHMQIQVIPVPQNIKSSVIKDAFMELALSNMDRQGKPSPLELAEITKNTELKQVLPANSPFFHVELPDGSRLLHRIRHFFPLQFGREAVCSPSVLNMKNRVNWRDCVLAKEKEMKFTQKFRDFFKPHDFTLEGGSDEEET